MLIKWNQAQLTAEANVTSSGPYLPNQESITEGIIASEPCIQYFDPAYDSDTVDDDFEDDRSLESDDDNLI